jgi:purine-nucleoside/S-methyl-5'-thioadenosine phosphorylase / adenosine deaminase
VIEAGIDALRRESGDTPLVAAIGPYIYPCHYEVDVPVLDALRQRFGDAVDRVVSVSRPGHWWLDLGGLAADALVACGVERAAIGQLPDACTACHSRFESHRRDGPRAGRLVHWIAASEA